MKLLAKVDNKALLEKRLLEFKQADRDAIMADGDNFTVSYEIELEYNEGGVGLDELRREEARAREDLEYESIGEYLMDYDAEDFFESYFDDVDDDERVDELIIKFIEENASTNSEHQTQLLIDVVKLQIAIVNWRDPADWAKETLERIVKPGTPENQKLLKFLAEKFKDQEEVVYDIVKSTQMNMGFSNRAGELVDPPYEPYEEKYTSLDPAEARRLIDKLFFYFSDPDDDVFPEGTQKSGTFFGIRELFYSVGHAKQFDDAIKTAQEQIVRILEKDYIRDVVDLPFQLRRHRRNNPYAAQTVRESSYLDAMINMLGTAAEEWVDETRSERMNEFHEDPLEYMDNNYGDNWDEYVEYPSSNDDLVEAIAEEFPNFYDKWGDSLKFEEDLSLTNGIEFSINEDELYMRGLDTAFEFLRDFFDEYQLQSSFSMDSNTGLHTNIGYLIDGEPAEEYNVIKSLMFLNHRFAVRGFESRENSRWVGDLKARAVREIRKIIDEEHADSHRFESPIRNLTNKNWDSLSRILSREVSKAAAQMGRTGIGFGITQLDDYNYIEFRYPGGRTLNYENMRDATLYYAHLVKLAADPGYRGGEFLTKMIGFVNKLNARDEFQIGALIKHLKKGAFYQYNSYRDRTDSGLLPYRNHASVFVHRAWRKAEAIPKDEESFAKENRYWRALARDTLEGDVLLYKGVEKGTKLYNSLARFEKIRATRDDPPEFTIVEVPIPMETLLKMFSGDNPPMRKISAGEGSKLEEFFTGEFEKIKQGAGVVKENKKRKKIKMKIL